MDRLAAMQAFVSVVETGSFTRAAQALRLGRATVTELVQQLEAHLQVRLLQRTTRSVRPTVEGAAYFERAVALLADIAEAEASVGHAAAAPRGRLRVDVPSPLARQVLVPALPEFHARHPGIVLELGASDRTVDLVGEGVDCVIRGGELADPSLVARKLADLAFGVYAAPAYLARAGVPVHPREIDAGGSQRMVAFVSMRTGRRPLPMTLEREGERIEVRGRHALALDDGNAYMAAGVAGLGLLCAPAYLARPHLASGELVQVLADWQVETMPLYLAWPSRRHVSARLRAFIDWAAQAVPRGIGGG